MIVLHVVSSVNPVAGGVAQAVLSLAAGLSELGVQSEVLCIDDPNDEFLVDFRLSYTALGPARNPWGFSRKVKPWLKANLPRFDAVIIHGLWLYPSYAVWSVCHSNRVLGEMGYYVMPHGMLDPYFQRDPSRRLKAFRNEIYWRLIEKSVINDGRAILFTCEEEMLLAKETFLGYAPQSTKVIGLGVELPSYLALPESLVGERPEGHQPYILFLSRIHPKKGLDLLLRAYCAQISSLAELNDEVPRLVVAGPCDSPYGKEMQDLAKKLLGSRSRGSISFVGMLRGQEKWDAFSNCDAFILPSHQENFGIAVVEALAMGKPVLISRRVNIWREIESSGSGFTCEDDIEGIAGLMQKWFDTSRSIRVQMGKDARKCYLDHFRIEVAASRMLELISD